MHKPVKKQTSSKKVGKQRHDQSKPRQPIKRRNIHNVHLVDSTCIGIIKIPPSTVEHTFFIEPLTDGRVGIRAQRSRGNEIRQRDHDGNIYKPPIHREWK